LQLHKPSTHQTKWVPHVLQYFDPGTVKFLTVYGLLPPSRLVPLNSEFSVLRTPNAFGCGLAVHVIDGTSRPLVVDAHRKFSAKTLEALETSRACVWETYHIGVRDKEIAQDRDHQ